MEVNQLVLYYPSPIPLFYNSNTKKSGFMRRVREREHLKSLFSLRELLDSTISIHKVFLYKEICNEELIYYIRMSRLHKIINKYLDKYLPQDLLRYFCDTYFPLIKNIFE